MFRDWEHEEGPAKEILQEWPVEKEEIQEGGWCPRDQVKVHPGLLSSCFQTLTVSGCSTPHEMMVVSQASSLDARGNQVPPAKNVMEN